MAESVGAEPVRSLVLWFPDWPVTAVLRDPAASVDRDRPIGVFEKNLVVACSPLARAEGVRRGQRRRDAQARCSSLQVVAADPARDHRVFSPVVTAIEEIAPGVQVVRPGIAALRARGPARYYGGETAAAETLLGVLAGLRLDGVRAGVADGPFTAHQAARAALARAAPTATRPPPGTAEAAGVATPPTEGSGGIAIVPPGASAAFLAPLPVTVLDDGELVDLLSRLGVHTLGAFAAMAPDRVAQRFGARGERLHALAAGRDSAAVEPRTPPPELHREIAFEPPLELAEQVAFGMRIAADEFVDRLGALSLVCTELRVELVGERGGRSERVWLHPASFDAPAVVDRVRWQLAEEGQALGGSVALVRISPEAVDAASHHVKGLFGVGPEERVHHALSRVQAMLGHRGVLVPEIGGGRWLGERQVLVPWGDRVAASTRERPWPGSLPDPLPATVYPDPLPVQVTDAAGRPVAVGDRDALSAPPAHLGAAGRRRAIRSWAGPWPIHERSWDAARRRRAHRFQVVDEEQAAWLLVVEDGHWSAEGRYD